MEIDEFVKLHKPASTSRSRLAPYLADIYRLRRLGYSWVQVQSYLATKGVKVAFQTIAAYVKRHPEQPGESKDQTKQKTRQTVEPPAPAPAPAKQQDRSETPQADTEDENEDGQTTDSSYFNPSDLREIMESSIDLDKLKKAAKRHNPKRKKPHETGSD